MAIWAWAIGWPRWKRPTSTPPVRAALSLVPVAQAARAALSARAAPFRKVVFIPAPLRLAGGSRLQRLFRPFRSRLYLAALPQESPDERPDQARHPRHRRGRLYRQPRRPRLARRRLAR